MNFKIIGLILILFLSFGCRENIVEFSNETKYGNLYINSYPKGADIYLNDYRIGKTTPDSLINIQPGNYSVKLILLGYGVQTLRVDLLSGQKKYINVTFQNY
jgi:hypothetical protein